MRFRIHIVYYI
ncbi:UNVERIFIED_CONTAM: hypothetical protein GTU68_001475 [Idotea baltica]|nr:hypothetical protein [Idotea baltica]